MKKREILFLTSYAPMDLADLLSGVVSLRESYGCLVHSGLRQRRRRRRHTGKRAKPEVMTT